MEMLVRITDSFNYSFAIMLPSGKEAILWGWLPTEFKNELPNGAYFGTNI